LGSARLDARMSTVSAMEFLPEQLWLCAIPGAFAGAGLFYRGYRDARRTQTVLNVPVIEDVHAPVPEPQPEVIKLSSHTQPQSAAEMTLQGKIAAALLKAGISNPAVSTNGSRVQANSAGGASGAAPAMKREEPAPHPVKVSIARGAVVCLWGGPALFLFSVYVMLTHFGWL